MLLVGRFILGLAGGAFCIAAPLYGAEISEKEIRGLIGTFFKVMLNGGILFIYLIGPYVPDVTWINAICGSLSIVIGLIFLFMPESPVFLVMGNRIDEAKKSYKWLRGAQYDPQIEIDELQRELEESKKNKIDFRESMKMRSTKVAVLIGIGLMTFQQVNGINAVIFYSTDIIQSAQIQLSSEISTILLGVINLGENKFEI